MINEELYDQYKLKIQQLGSCATKEEILNQNLIIDIKNLITQGVDINTKDLTGYTLLHYVAMSKPIKELAQEGRASNNFDNVLDIPVMVSWYKANPFIKDSFGYTPSFLAAYAEDTVGYQMLSAYESSYATARTARALESISEMYINSEYVDGRGNVISLAAHQPKAFFNHHTHVLKIAQQLRGEHIKG